MLSSTKSDYGQNYKLYRDVDTVVMVYRIYSVAAKLKITGLYIQLQNSHAHEQLQRTNILCTRILHMVLSTMYKLYK